MKRRTFLTTASTVGIASAVSGASVASSAYNSISTGILLKEFDATSKTALDKFIADVTLNVQALGLDEKFAAHVAMPVRIISKEVTEDKQNITYKNKSGEYISLSINKGLTRIDVFKTI